MLIEFIAHPEIVVELPSLIAGGCSLEIGLCFASQAFNMLLLVELAFVVAFIVNLSVLLWLA